MLTKKEIQGLVLDPHSHFEEFCAKKSIPETYLFLKDCYPLISDNAFSNAVSVERLLKVRNTYLAEDCPHPINIFSGVKNELLDLLPEDEHDSIDNRLFKLLRTCLREIETQAWNNAVGEFEEFIKEQSPATIDPQPSIDNEDQHCCCSLF